MPLPLSHFRFNDVIIIIVNVNVFLDAQKNEATRYKLDFSTHTHNRIAKAVSFFGKAINKLAHFNDS